MVLLGVVDKVLPREEAALSAADVNVFGIQRGRPVFSQVNTWSPLK
jgi:hypothetical protein